MKKQMIHASTPLHIYAPIGRKTNIWSSPLNQIPGISPTIRNYPSKNLYLRREFSLPNQRRR